MTGGGFPGGSVTKLFKSMKERVLGTGLARFGMRVMSEMSRDDGTNLAAGVAYYAFLSLFPLTLGIIGLFGLFLPSREIQQQLFNLIDSSFPSARSILEHNITQVIQLRGTLGIIGIIGLLWSGSGALSAAGHAINRAWDVPSELRFYFKKPRDIGLTIGLGILFLLSAGAGTAIGLTSFKAIPFIGAGIIQVIIRIIAFLLAFMVFLILFKVIPNTRTYWRHVWPGALFTAVLFELGRVLFIFYIDNFVNYALVYGTIGSIIALLVWIYYSSVIVILGAELTAEYGRMRRGIRKRVN